MLRAGGQAFRSDRLLFGRIQWHSPRPPPGIWKPAGFEINQHGSNRNLDEVDALPVKFGSDLSHAGFGRKAINADDEHSSN